MKPRTVGYHFKLGLYHVIPSRVVTYSGRRAEEGLKGGLRAHILYIQNVLFDILHTSLALMFIHYRQVINEVLNI